MNKKIPFATFYWNVLKEFHLSPIEGLLLTLVDGLSHNKYRTCYASRRRLAEYLNVSETAVYDLIDRLVRRNLLVRGRRTHLKTMALNVSGEFYDFLQSQKWGGIEGRQEVPEIPSKVSGR